MNPVVAFPAHRPALSRVGRVAAPAPAQWLMQVNGPALVAPGTRGRSHALPHGAAGCRYMLCLS